MIPENRMAAVSRGLREAFDRSDIEDIRRMDAGLSSDLVFRIVVQGSPFVLRLMADINERNDPGRIFACMKAAAEAGLAPRVRYVSREDGVSIIDFVESMAFPAAQALVQVPGLLRRVHALPQFPKEFNFVTAHNGFMWRFRRAGLLSQGEIEEVFPCYEQVCAVYPRLDSDMVSCHSDLKPENILFDGQRVWLAGWQAAFVNDRYFDLAIAANFLVENDVDERTYLEQYFGRKADEYESARFFLMGQVLHMFYATVFLMLGSAGKPVDQSETLPSFGEFHRRIWEGEVNLAKNDLKVVYGRIHWKRLLDNTRQTRFHEALRIVSERSAKMGNVRLLLPSPPEVDR